MKRAREKVWPREREGAKSSSQHLRIRAQQYPQATDSETPSRPADRVGQAVERRRDRGIESERREACGE